MNIDPVIEAKRRYRKDLLSRKNVVACGVGFKNGAWDDPCVVVSVARKEPEARLASVDIVPKSVGAVKTDVVEIGEIRALRTGRHRPAPGGVSIGHVNVSAGTLGCLVVKDRELFILSNNHILSDTNAGKKGDSIVQPGKIDGGTEQIATLEDFVPINFGGTQPDCPVVEWIERAFNKTASVLGSSHRVMAYRQLPDVNLVDAAIAKPLSDSLVEKNILDVGEPRGVRDAFLGMWVKKSGRTTGVTDGTITQIDVTAQVSYGLDRVATFENQLVATGMSAGGDSGSAVLEANNYVVGLLFAGSDAVTLINPIQAVLDALSVEIA